MRNAVTALLIICCIAAVTEAEQLKVPDGCRPAQGAKPGPEGYADRIIHRWRLDYNHRSDVLSPARSTHR